ncbi:MAG: LysE family translocator [Methanobacteriaceae archaeon]|nr:MAG: lysine transporter LysE [Methanobacterium sp. BRmetb2]MCC7557164.1 LysE family translocator [Methanobacteriaceae archaeon]
MLELIFFVLTSFAAGLSGALVPGPMLTVTISDSLKKGYLAGPMVVSGHIIAEIVLIILIIGGLRWLIDSPMAALVIGVLGGFVLMFMGYNLFKTDPDSYEPEEELKSNHSSIADGIITSISNPYFFIWWATIGFAFMFKGLEIAGIVGLLGFLVGHWSADLSWYSMVSFFTSKGSRIMNKHSYTWIMRICGVFLVALGLYFITSVTILK